MPDHLGILTGRLLTEGEWAGWRRMSGEPFVDLVGPFYHRDDHEGCPQFGMTVSARHLNSGGVMHGGAMTTFIDCALFAFARTVTEQRMVTLSLRNDFIGAAVEGERLHCIGRVTGKTGSMIFLQGQVRGKAQILSAFDAILKIRPGSAQNP